MNLIPAQQGPHWDSTLEPAGDNRLRLTLRLRVFLNPYQPGDRFQFGPYAIGEGILRDLEMNQEYRLFDWIDPLWASFCTDFQKIIQSSWSDRFVLVPNKSWFIASPGGNPAPAVIECGLSIQVLTSVALNPHFTFHCFMPVAGSPRPSANYKERRGLLTVKSMNYGESVSVVDIGGKMHRVWFFQRQVVHEFGHVLGLPHVNGNSDGDKAYGTTLEQRANVMGAGRDFSAAEAQPWLTTLPQHLAPQNDADRSVQFTAQVGSPDLVSYFDEGPIAVMAGPCVTVPRETTPNAVQGPAGALWRHLPNAPLTE